MRDQKPIRTARRKVRRLGTLGTDSPVCLYCGCSEIALLRRVTKKFLEDHHLLGESHDPNLTALLCRNCHYLATENLLRADVSMLPEPDQLKRTAIMLRALSVHHRMLSDTHWRLARSLEGLRPEKENQ